MIEGRGFPVLFAVTGLALGAEYAFVIVVLLVTGKAIGLKLGFVQMARVAALALDGFMLVDQRVLVSRSWLKTISFQLFSV